MALEIERKYLVDTSQLPKLENGISLKQGYIETAPGNVVRVRTANHDAFLTIKGKTENLSRLEYEYAIPFSDALELLDKLCSKPIISKTRFNIYFAGKKWELDVFEGDNEGLYVAEIELSSEEEVFEIPNWIKEEVSHLKEYRNNYLAVNPFKNWEK